VRQVVLSRRRKRAGDQLVFPAAHVEAAGEMEDLREGFFLKLSPQLE